MPSKRKPLPIIPSRIEIIRDNQIVSVMSQLGDNERLFVICPRCEKHVQLSRYGHRGNFDGHYGSKKCNQALDRKTRKQLKETLVEKFGPMYGL